MTDGPNGPVIDNLSDIRFELMQLNLYMRDLLTSSQRELPAPVVNVAPAPVVVEAPTSAVQPFVWDGLYDRLATLGTDPAQLAELKGLREQISELTLSVRAGAMQSVASGSSFVTAQIRNEPGQVVNVRDTFSELEFLDDQTGAANVLQFDFTSEVDLVFVRVESGSGRASNTAADAPTATRGIPCPDSEPTPIPIHTANVWVYATAGALVHVWGFRY